MTWVLEEILMNVMHVLMNMENLNYVDDYIDEVSVLFGVVDWIDLFEE
jgi:hypothetical protein